MSEEKDKASRVFTFAFYKLNYDDMSDKDKELWQDIKDVADSANSLESKLKEAEDMLTDGGKLVYADYKVAKDKIEFLEQRLFHLMDVSGKMAVALEKCYAYEESSREEAKLALASWQDVKEDSRG